MTWMQIGVTTAVAGFPFLVILAAAYERLGPTFDLIVRAAEVFEFLSDLADLAEILSILWEALSIVFHILSLFG